MRTSESTKELVTALSKAQSEFPKIVKDAENPYFKSKYADLSSIVNAVQDTLGKYGLAVTQHLETEFQSYFDSEGTVRGERSVLCVVTRLEHNSGEFEESTLRVALLDGKPQTMGSASTYVRRYALQSVLRLAAEEDDGNASSLNERWSKEDKERYVKDKAKKLQDDIDEQKKSAVAKAKLQHQLEASVKDLAEAKEMDANPPKATQTKSVNPDLISDLQVKMVFTIATKRGLSEQEVFDALGTLGYEHLRELPRSQVGTLLNEIDPEYRFHARDRAQ